MLSPEQLAEIRERYVRPTAYEGVVAVFGAGFRQTYDDIAALLAHIDEREAEVSKIHEEHGLAEKDEVLAEIFDRMHLQLVTTEERFAGEVKALRQRYAALTPEVIETLIFGMKYAELAAKDNLDFGPADSFATARTALTPEVIYWLDEACKRANESCPEPEIAAARTALESLK